MDTKAYITRQQHAIQGDEAQVAVLRPQLWQRPCTLTAIGIRMRCNEAARMPIEAKTTDLLT